MSWDHFDNIMVLFIIISSVNLAIYNPLEDPESTFSKVVSYIDISMTTIIIFEALIKIVALGFAFNGKESYLRSVWNKLDFAIALISISTFFNLDNFSALKVFPKPPPG